MNKNHFSSNYLLNQVNWFKQWSLNLAGIYLLISLFLDYVRFPVDVLNEIYFARLVFMAAPILGILVIFYNQNKLKLNRSFLEITTLIGVMIIGIGHAEILSIAENYGLFFPKIGVTIILIYIGLLLALPIKFAIVGSVVVIVYTCYIYLETGVPRKDVISYFSFYSMFSSCCILMNVACFRILKSNSVLMKSTDDLAHTDELTGLYNRRFFYLESIKHVKQAVRDDVEYAVISIDLDNFKPLNDHFGHKSGDEALANVGDILDSYCQRPFDFATRMGGDEFTLFMYGTTPAHIEKTCNNIISDILDLQWKTSKNHDASYLSASIGAVVVKAEIQDFIHMNDVVELADDLLYEVKKGQKNAYKLKVI